MGKSIYNLVIMIRVPNMPNCRFRAFVDQKLVVDLDIFKMKYLKKEI